MRRHVPRRQASGGAVVGLVFVGGAAGGVARHGLTLALPAPGGWPWGTFSANTVGAFLLAVVVVVVVELFDSPWWARPALGTGFCGAFTTMSAVVVTVDTLAMQQRPWTGAGFLAVSMLAGLAAATLGLLVGRAVAGLRPGGPATGRRP